LDRCQTSILVVPVNQHVGSGVMGSVIPKDVLQSFLLPTPTLTRASEIDGVKAPSQASRHQILGRGDICFSLAKITYTTTSKTFTTNQIGSIDESDGLQLRETDAISLTPTLSMDTRGHMPVKAKASRRRSRQR
jgi:hypothetical protein